jgi:2-hydroxy-6-oxonona-2,4-dienedioate hydrolase
LLVWGVEDRSLPYEIGIEAMNRFTRGRFLFLTQSGHWPQTEQADAFNQAMVAFLDSVRNRGA